MITDLKRTMAYICPYCSNINKKNINIFSLHLPQYLHCSDNLCLEECVAVSDSGGKYKLEVECPVCGDSHTYFASKSAFWNRELITFSCIVRPDINIFFAGSEAAVGAALKKETASFSELSRNFDDDTELINRIYTILETIHELAKSKKLVCRCGSHEVYPELENGIISLICSDCGASMRLEPTDSVINKLRSCKNIIIGR